MLDATTLFAAANGESATLSRLARLPIGDVAVSAVVYSELLGAAGAVGPDARLAENLALIALNMDVLPFDRAAAESYARLIDAVAPKRRKMLDRLAAAHAIAEGRTLVTLAPHEFAGLPGLALEAWGG